MDDNDTRRRLSTITDPGHFEKLATAVLREADEHYRRFAHVGVNEQGKTVRSAVDAIAYASIDGRRHMLAVHHTTCGLRDLRRKWLTDPDSDLCKTIREVSAQRDATPELEATLILTTNKEPTVELIHDVDRTAREAGIDVKVWPGSALAHFLDIEPRGQWIRKTFFGVGPLHLSEQLLSELSVRSVSSAQLPDDPRRWVDRYIDTSLKSRLDDHLQFVLGDSGVGKSVACLKCLQQHIQAGGFGLIITDEVLAASFTVEDAIERMLRSLQPTLTVGVGSEALTITPNHEKFLLVVEDISRSAQPTRLVEKLTSWSIRARTGKDRCRWRILCPVWPQTIAQANDSVHRLASESWIVVASFAQDEGVAAVKRRHPRITDLEAESVASALGFDPLLIALHGDNEGIPESESVIHEYIERSLARVSTSSGRFSTGEYRNALCALSIGILSRRRLEPRFLDVLKWSVGERPIEAMLRDMLGHREVIRLEGPPAAERVVFRHDRVRDHVLSASIAGAISRDDLPAQILSEPFFAEIIGAAVANNRVSSAAVESVAAANPLALICALRHCSTSEAGSAQLVIRESKRWAARGAWRDPLNQALRTAILRVLAECEGLHVRALCETIGRDHTDIWSLRGRFRNGDLNAGVQLCALTRPGVGWAGHVELIDHVVKKRGAKFVLELGRVLRNVRLNAAARSGTLRLAGYVASPKLAGALRRSWLNDLSRKQLLSDYFWACSQCCGDDTRALLEPIVDAWAAMPDDHDGHGDSPRIRFGADELRWALRDRVPVRAIDYLISRSRDSELSWPMLVMLNGIDNPDVVEFVVRELAQLDRQLQPTGHFSPFAASAVDEWSRRQDSSSTSGHILTDRGSQMSPASRKRLRDLWSCSNPGTHLRRGAFRFWCATIAEGDISILRTIDTNSDISDLALFERIRRGDLAAIPALITKLDGDSSRYWWHAGRYLWTDELTECLNRALARRSDELSAGRGHDLDYILARQLTELPSRTAERLIVENWEGLRQSADYVKAALHVATPDLLYKVAIVVAESDDPRSIFDHLSISFGLEFVGRCGLTRPAQRDGLLPYLKYLSETDIRMIWRACNKNRWFEWRREHIDYRAKEAGTRFVSEAIAIAELDRDLHREGPLFRMNHWGERYLETGVSNEHMIRMVVQWASDRGTDRALLMAADLVTRFGHRRHVALLHGHRAAKSRFGQRVIENTDFDLRLRSLD